MNAMTAPATTRQPPILRSWLSDCSLSCATIDRQPRGARSGPIPSTTRTSPSATHIELLIRFP